MTDTSLVEVTINDIRVIRQGRVLALASAELTVDGVSFALHGMQVIRTRDATTGKDALGVDLPRYCRASTLLTGTDNQVGRW